MIESAGILPYRRTPRGIEVYLGHMGGPYWKNRPRSWSIIKGEVKPGEGLLDTAKREFEEETGKQLTANRPDQSFHFLGDVSNGQKRLHVWTIPADFDTAIHSNRFTIEWPPHSGQKASFPEIDKAAWIPIDQAKSLIAKYQEPLLERLEKNISLA